MLLIKLPCFDPLWPDGIKEKWLGIFEKLVDREDVRDPWISEVKGENR